MNTFHFKCSKFHVNTYVINIASCKRRIMYLPLLILILNVNL